MNRNATPDPADLNREDYSATYCPEDDKLRLYVGRVERATYDWLRSLGFQSTPKQDCDFAAVWTVARENAALAMIAEGDDIGDEDQTPEDRAADRAERFSVYRDKRRGEAHGYGDTYEAGPSAYGAQDARRAERQAAQRDRIGERACSQWSKAEYWQRRTAGVIANALHRSSAPVRRSRIVRLGAEQRKHLKEIEDAQKRFDAWSKVLADPEAEGARLIEDGERIDAERAPKALKLAYHLANYGGGYDHEHPRTGRKASIYCHMTDPVDPITAHEAATLAIGGRTRPAPGRYGEHLSMRLAYERQMLEAEGGAASNVEMEPGGLLGGQLIVKVNKSQATGAVVSVNIHCPSEGQGWDYRRRGETLLLNVQRFGERVYSPPTEESRAKLAEILDAQKKRTKKANAAKPKLINPTNEDAEKLQAALNAERAKRNRYGTPKVHAVLYITQKQYSANSKGSYSALSTQYLRRGPSLHPSDRTPYGADWSHRPIACKIRTRYDQVVVITDKPQKPLPDWSPVAEAEEVAAR